MNSDNYTGLVNIKCPVSDHLLFQARAGDWPSTHIVIRCRQCKSYILIQSVDSVHKIEPPPEVFHHAEFTRVSAQRR